MTLSNGVAVACGICILSNAAFAKGENNKSSDLVGNQLGSNESSEMLKDAFVKEFSSIMSIKNARILTLKRELIRLDKLINSSSDRNESSLMEQDTSTPTSQTTNNTENNETKNSPTWELKDFLKRRLKNVFQSELNDILKEKSCQIYLLEELLAEKRKSLKLRRKLREKRDEEGKVTFGVGEPSLEY